MNGEEWEGTCASYRRIHEFRQTSVAVFKVLVTCYRNIDDDDYDYDDDNDDNDNDDNNNNNENDGDDD
ncbi:hypothetical protein HZH68_004519 [Vespula germanica]|uniref:Uncharacterized protein n=1 Tax=Vespula germanica TaxID=30212 RepID=A0A834KNZ3_VESGE|nr:hypothetical protein HZH68_004519 [Vespula germanica]